MPVFPTLPVIPHFPLLRILGNAETFLQHEAYGNHFLQLAILNFEKYPQYRFWSKFYFVNEIPSICWLQALFVILLSRSRKKNILKFDGHYRRGMPNIHLSRFLRNQKESILDSSTASVELSGLSNEICRLWNFAGQNSRFICRNQWCHLWPPASVDLETISFLNKREPRLDIRFFWRKI